MLRRSLFALTAASVLVTATPSPAAAPEGGIWSSHKKSKRAKARKRQQAATNAGEEAQANSQAPENASTTGVAHADDSSVLAAGSVAATALPGLTTGLAVKTSAGATLGTVSEVVTGTDGSVRLVLVTGTGGQTFRLLPDQLSVSGGIVTTTQADIGG